MTDLVVTPVVAADFPRGTAFWQPGGQLVLAPTPGTPAPAPQTRDITLSVAVLEGGDVHLRLVLDAAPAIHLGDVVIPPESLADVIAAMQAAPPVSQATKAA
jgi:hypothetical protein